MENKIKKLSEAKEKLKKDFVGLDKIIDKVIDSITPWYLTPEILERPTVVSLWGLTGTGKTSLVRKLINYLDISDKSLFFDCGEESGGDSDLKLFSEKLDSLFESSAIQENDPRFSEEKLKELGIKINKSSEECYTHSNPFDFAFIFDEFQYLNTKDPMTGDETVKSSSRAIWSMMDSGIVDINSNHYKIKEIINYIEDLEAFSEEHPSIKIKDGKFDKSLSKLLRNQLSYYRWNIDTEELDDTSTGINLIIPEDCSFFIRKLNMIQKGLGFEVENMINSFTSLIDFIRYIKKYVSLISKPKIINCSRSLIFVLGNLDEAFGLTDDELDPDIDADVYHEMTSQVNCMDIKAALRKRFRDEQIGRLGNNIIIYPSLRRCDFEKVLEKELDRITSKFKDTSGKTINITEKFKKLIYSEGCFPIQGVRPLFSTINTIISPILSIIILDKEEKEYVIDVREDNFNVPKVTVEIKTKDENLLKEKETALNLGELRSTERCKKIALQSVHEASHAILYYLLTGKCPSAIVASNIFGNGGYMMNSINLDSSTECITEFRNDIIVSLAGYYGEREFFEENMCSLGASSDLSSVWSKLVSAFFDSGFKIPMKFSEKNVSQENGGKPFGFPYEETELRSDLEKFIKEICEETKKLVKQERKAIREVSLRLYETRCMSPEEFKSIASKYLTREPQNLIDNYYIDILRNENS